MLELTSIAVDPKLAHSGVWFEYFGGSFLVARQGAEHQAELGRLFTENAELIKAGGVEGNAKLVEIYQRAFAKTAVLDWKGVTQNGEELPYSAELAYKILSNPLYAELAVALERFSLTHSNYQVKVEQDLADEVKSSAVS
jgi:hypothetical protein